MDRNYNNNNNNARQGRRPEGHPPMRDYDNSGGNGGSGRGVGSMNQRSRSRDRDYNNRDYNSRYNNNRRSRSRSPGPRDRSRRGYGGPEDDYDSRDGRSNYNNSSAYRNDRHRGQRTDDYRGDGSGGFDRRDNYHNQRDGHGGYSRGGGNNSPNSYNNRDRRDHRSQHEDDYDSYDSDDGGKYTTQTPHNKIIVRGLVPQNSEADINSDLMQYNLKPISIRLIRRKNTGASRGFAFVEFSTEEEATRWMNHKQGVLQLDQVRAVLHYSDSRGPSSNGGNDRRGGQSSGGNMDNVSDWYCSKCLVFNFKRRENCFKCYASREESERGGDGWDEISNVLTKKIILRNLDVLTNEEGVLTVMQEVLPLEQVAKISKILVCRDPLTNTSRGICYLSFDTLVDSMNVFTSLKALDPPLTLDERNVGISYCIDGAEASGNQEMDPNDSKSSRQQNYKEQTHNYNDYYDQHDSYDHDNYQHQSSAIGPSLPAHHDNNSSSSLDLVATTGHNTFQYTLTDVPRLAEYAAQLYATNTAEHEHYYKYYTTYYIGEIEAGNFANLPTVNQLGGDTANSGAAVAQIAIQRKQQQQKDKQGKKRSHQSYEKETQNTSTSSSVQPQQQQPQMYWDGENWVYPTTAGTSNSTPSTEPEKMDQMDMDPGRAPDKVKHAKKIVKDMEKWAKQLNQKKDWGAGGGGGALQLPVPVKEEHPLRPGGALSAGADVGFAILEKKDKPLPLTPQLMVPRVATSSAIAAAANNSKVAQYGSDSDNEEKRSSGQFVANEKDYVDFKKLTCLLCKRAFQSEEILGKHIKMSDLHKQNLAKYNAEKGGGAGMSTSGNGGGAEGLTQSELELSYRDRAKERRQKYGEADPPPLNKSRERFHKEIEKQASAAALVAASAQVAQTPIGGGNVGNKLLMKMGWKDGQGLGRKNQGRTNIIEVESRSQGAGLGTKTAAPPFAGGDYKTYIKTMMKKRYEQLE